MEVKTISRETQNRVSRENNSAYRAEENMHKKKIDRLHRAIQSYIGEFSIKGDWQLDLVAVVLFVKDKKAECRFIENVL